MNLLVLAVVVFTVHFVFATIDVLPDEKLSTALVEGLAAALFWGLLLLFPAFVPGWAAFLVLLGLASLRRPRVDGRVLALALSPVVGVFFYVLALVDRYVPVQEVVTSVAFGAFARLPVESNEQQPAMGGRGPAGAACE
jgi:hypothetical protein